MAAPDLREWLEADGLGGFASGTVSGPRTRRYHALLLAAATPPTGRFVLVNGFDAWLETAAGTYALTSQRYRDGVEYPNGRTRIAGFTTEPWPTWQFHCEDGTRLELELFAARGSPVTCLRFAASGNPSRAQLTVRPFFSGRDYHALHHENAGFSFRPAEQGDRLTFAPYPGVPSFTLCSNGLYRHQPDWYRQFFYPAEDARGLDAMEDLASPGTLAFDLSAQPGALVLAAEGAPSLAGGALSILESLRAAEGSRRRRFPSRLARSAEAYLVKRGGGQTVVAGYPWFTDWGRDTFISLRGLCGATGRWAEGAQVLLEWAGQVSQGMLPNRFADAGTTEFNAVDASLWFVVAVGEALSALGAELPEASRTRLLTAVSEILAGYAAGTRYRIHLDADGLIAAGEPGVQLTWMDARVGERVVTPRIGKPVEIQALWVNALEIGAALGAGDVARWRSLAARARASFGKRFWNPERACLYDVVDVGHRPGAVDGLLRPNQVFAIGGLPHALLEGERAQAVFDAVESNLWTPLGLRSLAPGEPGYASHYRGGPGERDAAYHQGTVWPWLTGALIDAFLRLGGDASTARARYLTGLIDHLEQAGLGHVSEVADGEAPHTPGGCPFQAWSLGELLRALQRVEKVKTSAT